MVCQNQVRLSRGLYVDASRVESSILNIANSEFSTILHDPKLDNQALAGTFSRGPLKATPNLEPLLARTRFEVGLRSKVEDLANREPHIRKWYAHG